MHACMHVYICVRAYVCIREIFSGHANEYTLHIVLLYEDKYSSAMQMSTHILCWMNQDKYIQEMQTSPHNIWLRCMKRNIPNQCYEYT